MTSKEKIDAALDEALKGDGLTDGKTARMRQALGMMLPLVRRLGVIPEDPAELDELLLKGARVALALRSDGAALPETIEQLLGFGEPA